MLKSKALLTTLLMGYCLSAFASSPHTIAYLEPWDPWVLKDPAALEMSHVNTYILSFGYWDEHGNIYSNGEFARIPAYDPNFMAPGYIAWTSLKYGKGYRKMLLTFGGPRSDYIWSYIKTPEAREILANNIVELMNTDFPVYMKNLDLDRMVGECLHAKRDGTCDLEKYQLAGTVRLDGVDFDFEKTVRSTPEENANLLALATRIRELAPSKIMSLTTYHVGADPAECANSGVTENCSYVEPDRLEHHGEVSELLVSSKNIFNFFNVRAYDVGTNFKYQVAMENFAKKVGYKSKIVLGSTFSSQWGPAGQFVETDENNITRAKWQSQNGFGGVSVWKFGSDDRQLPMAAQVSIMNAMIEAMTGAVAPVTPVTPVQPVEPAKPVIPAREDRTTLNNLPDRGSVDIGSLLKLYKTIDIISRDRGWVDKVVLPATGVPEGSVVKFRRTAGWSTSIISQEYGVDTPLMNETHTYTYTNGAWHADIITISTNAELRALDKPDSLAKFLKEPITLKLLVLDGHWAPDFYLPQTASEGAVVQLTRNSSWATNMHVNGQTIQIGRATSITLRFKSGAWQL